MPSLPLLANTLPELARSVVHVLRAADGPVLVALCRCGASALPAFRLEGQPEALALAAARALLADTEARCGTEDAAPGCRRRATELLRRGVRRRRPVTAGSRPGPLRVLPLDRST